MKSVVLDVIWALLGIVQVGCSAGNCVLAVAERKWLVAAEVIPSFLTSKALRLEH